VRVTEHWNRLPRGAVNSAFLEIFKALLDEVLCSHILFPITDPLKIVEL